VNAAPAFDDRPALTLDPPSPARSRPRRACATTPQGHEGHASRRAPQHRSRRRASRVRRRARSRAIGVSRAGYPRRSAEVAGEKKKAPPSEESGATFRDSRRVQRRGRIGDPRSASSASRPPDAAARTIATQATAAQVQPITTAPRGRQRSQAPARRRRRARAAVGLEQPRPCPRRRVDEQRARDAGH